MLDVFFLMLAVAANTGISNVSTGSVASAALTNQESASEAAPSQTAAPSFLAPAPTAKATAAAPAFLAPKAQQTPSASAAPAFLAPVAKPGLVAEPQTPTGRFTTATEVKPILNATKANWILVREFDGKDLLYVTHLMAWRCGLAEMRVGINGNTPEIWPLPDCHLDQPSPGALLEQDGLPYVAYGLGSIAMVEVEITYDDLSKDSVKISRQGMIIQ